MNEYLTVKNTDDLLGLVKRVEDDFVLVSNKEIRIPANGLFDYTSPLLLEMPKLNEVAYAIPACAENDDYFIRIEDLTVSKNKISLDIKNVTNRELVLPAGTKLGHIYLANSISAELAEPYYIDENLMVKEINQGVIKNFVYVIDEKGLHKLVLNLNKRLYESETPTTITLKGE